MTKLLRILSLFIFLFVYVACDDDDDDGPFISDLELSIDGLENLGADYVYEGWIIVNGNPVSTGVFSVDDNGNLSKSSFAVDEEMLEMASAFVLTIEPMNDSDPSPSNIHILAGNFQNDTGLLSIDHPAALGSDFSAIWGKFILATPTDGVDMDENSGIWFLDLSSGTPAVGMSLPELPDGWKYEGWAVIEGTPVTSGKFDVVDEMDFFDGFSSTEASGPPFPGEDYLMNAPAGLVFPTDLAGGTAVISIEPEPDNSPAPFLLKPLVSPIAADATDHVTYDMAQNLNFPTGTVNR